MQFGMRKACVELLWVYRTQLGGCQVIPVCDSLPLVVREFHEETALFDDLVATTVRGRCWASATRAVRCLVLPFAVRGLSNSIGSEDCEEGVVLAVGLVDKLAKIRVLALIEGRPQGDAVHGVAHELFSLLA